MNYIFNAYKKRYTLPIDADVTFEGHIYNNLQDFFHRCPEIQKGSSPGRMILGQSHGLDHYLFCELLEKSLVKHESTLAHEIAHSLNYYNRKERGIHMITRGNRTEHDEVYAFDRGVGREM